jgi:hypothetical protein
MLELEFRRFTGAHPIYDPLRYVIEPHPTPVTAATLELPNVRELRHVVAKIMSVLDIIDSTYDILPIVRDIADILTSDSSRAHSMVVRFVDFAKGIPDIITVHDDAVVIKDYHGSKAL